MSNIENSHGKEFGEQENNNRRIHDKNVHSNGSVDLIELVTTAFLQNNQILGLLVDKLASLAPLQQCPHTLGLSCQQLLHPLQYCQCVRES